MIWLDVPVMMRLNDRRELFFRWKLLIIFDVKRFLFLYLTENIDLILLAEPLKGLFL